MYFPQNGSTKISPVDGNKNLFFGDGGPLYTNHAVLYHKTVRELLNSSPQHPVGFCHVSARRGLRHNNRLTWMILLFLWAQETRI